MTSLLLPVVLHAVSLSIVCFFSSLRFFVLLFFPHLHLHVTARSAPFVASRDIVYATSIPHSNRTKILQGCWHLKPGSACGQNVLESDLPASSLHTSADFLLKRNGSHDVVASVVSIRVAVQCASATPSEEQTAALAHTNLQREQRSQPWLQRYSSVRASAHQEQIHVQHHRECCIEAENKYHVPRRHNRRGRR